jgi:hypothetical protein
MDSDLDQETFIQLRIGATRAELSAADATDNSSARREASAGKASC